jgi:hypothetical protein
MGNDFANTILIARHRPGKFASPSGNVHRTVHVVGKDDPGVDMERCTGAHLPNRVAQCVDARHQQIRPTVKKVHGKEERSTRSPIAAIVRHVGSKLDLRYRRNALRFSALRCGCTIRHGQSAFIPEIRSKIDAANWPIPSRHLAFLRWTSPNVENAARPRTPALLRIAAAYSASGKRMMKPSRFGMHTLDNVSVVADELIQREDIGGQRIGLVVG